MMTRCSDHVLPLIKTSDNSDWMEANILSVGRRNRLLSCHAIAKLDDIKNSVVGDTWLLGASADRMS